MDKNIYQITKRVDGQWNVWRRKLNSTWKLVGVFSQKRDAKAYVFRCLA